MWAVSHTLHTICILIKGQRHASLCACAVIEFSATTEVNTKENKYENKLRKVRRK